MASQQIESRLAFCSWSVQPTGLDDLMQKADQIGVRRLHLAIDPLRESPADWADAGERLASADVTIASAMFTTVGEDYSSIARIHETGGVAPDATWPKTWENFQKMTPMVQALGLKLVTFHAGFIPTDHNDPVFAKVIGRLQQTADLAAKYDVEVALETGQESAKTLNSALAAIGRPNLGVNFDPANMILYGSGDPIEALWLLAPKVKQVHIKDATKSAKPGVDWGAEVVVGAGEVDWKAFFAVLSQHGYTGALPIEREAGDQRIADIRAARDFLLKTI